MDGKSFVCTSDEETRKKLLKEGLIEVQNSNGLYTFILGENQTFSVDDKKVTFSNNLCI